MSEQTLAKELTIKEIFRLFPVIIGPERSFYWLAIIYGVGISALTLALPISVQMLVNTIANTALTTPLVILTLTLFALLSAAALLNALRIHLMDLFSRRFYARMVSEIAMRSVFAVNPFFRDYKMGSLFNRYFDILIVHKTVPYLLVGGFTTVLSLVFGFILVSLYHPLFLAFVIVVIFLVWLVWLIWGGRAIHSAIEVSHKKHATAAWLDGLGDSNGFFKSERHIDEALLRTDTVTSSYIDAHVKHFRHHFAQSLCLLLLYATASAGLLGLGGWLVIQGELSLGQLVAAELVLSVAFFGLSQLGTYLAYFYELCAAIEELSLFYDVQQDEPKRNLAPFDGDGSVDFVNATGDARGQACTLSFSIPSGARVLGYAETQGVEREVTNFLKRHYKPASGYVALGGQDIMGIQAHELRRHIIVLDQPNAIEMTIREYLDLSTDGASSTQVLTAIKAVGLEQVIAQLENGFDTRIASTGWPLAITETMQLKLAAAIIAEPKVLILGELFDTMPDVALRRSLDLLSAADTTVIYFSSRTHDLGFDKYLYLGHQQQVVFDSYDEFCSMLGAADFDSEHGAPVPAT